MEKVLLVGCGGFLGSTARYLLGGLLARSAQTIPVPIGTLTVNILGCLLLGFLAGLAEFKGMFSPEIRVFLFIGILGGFTTFSTFGHESFLLFRDGQHGWAWMNAGLHVVLGLGASWMGISFSRIV